MAEYAHDIVVPYKESGKSKKSQVADMFDDIAPRYDFLNRFLSAGIDVVWRKKALDFLSANPPQQLLDIATGTADVALMAEKKFHPRSIIGVDISDGMLEIGRKKIIAAGLEDKITLMNADSAALPFDNNSFDAVTVAFGVRNFQYLEKGLSEIYRVLRPGGRLVVLEFSRPKRQPIKALYGFYMNKVAANLGKLFSKNNCAYGYLDESIRKFPEGKDFTKVLDVSGFKNTLIKPLSLGICCIYCGTK
ncbi:MAG: bifunctional demethylmenaquinone methyltransferase/2-methoxy-6-polyprenyl-1,4-benzoquinol methylase UbiE [Ferruginibacter sp.]